MHVIRNECYAYVWGNPADGQWRQYNIFPAAPFVSGSAGRETTLNQLWIIIFDNHHKNNDDVAVS